MPEGRNRRETGMPRRAEQWFQNPSQTPSVRALRYEAIQTRAPRDSWPASYAAVRWMCACVRVLAGRSGVCGVCARCVGAERSHARAGLLCRRRARGGAAARARTHTGQTQLRRGGTGMGGLLPPAEPILLGRPRRGAAGGGSAASVARVCVRQYAGRRPRGGQRGLAALARLAAAFMYRRRLSLTWNSL